MPSSADASTLSAPGPGIACSAFSTMLASARRMSVRSTQHLTAAGPATSFSNLDAARQAGAVRVEHFGDELRQVDRRELHLRRRREARELGRDLAEQPHLTEDRVHAAFEHAPERLALVGMHAEEVLGGQLDRRQRVLDLVRHLARHLGPGFEPVRALELARAAP